MRSRVISAPFSTWKLPRAFSTRDALNKTCSRSSRSSDLAHPPPQPLLSCSHAAKHTRILLFVDCTATHVHTVHTRLLTQIHVLHGRVLFSFPFPLLFPLVTLQHLSTVLLSLSLPSFCTTSGTSLFISFFLSLPLSCLRRLYSFSLSPSSISLIPCTCWGCFLPRLSLSLAQARPNLFRLPR